MCCTSILNKISVHQSFSETASVFDVFGLHSNICRYDFYDILYDSAIEYELPE